MALLAIALSPAAVSAQTLGKLQWNGAGSSFLSSFDRSGALSTISGYAGGPYSAKFQINGAPSVPVSLLPEHGTGTAFGPAVDILCIDFLHTAKTGTYNVWFTNLGAPSGGPYYDDLTYTRGKDRDTYQKLAWLTMEMESLGFTAADKQDRVDIHAAMWNILTGEPIAARVGTSGAWSDDLYDWVALANNPYNYSTVMLRNWTVVTHACVGAHTESQVAAPDGCGQEFLVHSGTETVPEPATMILFATGLLGMAGAGIVGRRRPDDSAWS